MVSAWTGKDFWIKKHWKAMLPLEDMNTKKLRSLPELLKPVYLAPRYFHRSVLSQGFQPDKECCGGFPQTKNTLFLCTMRRNY